jgi:uncharacterized membrane protein YraQ (UPF0718 family)
MDIINTLGHALLDSALMFWATLWSLIAGLILSAAIQVVVPKEKIAGLLGEPSLKGIAIATAAGAASSSCSYAAVAMSKSLFQKGAHLIPTLAFMFASTNLVLELSFVLWILLGPVFVLAELLGGILLIVIMSIIVKLTYPKYLAKNLQTKDLQTKDLQPKDREENLLTIPVGEHQTHQADSQKAPSPSWQAKLTTRSGLIEIAQAFMHEWKMLSKEIIIGFLIAGLLSAFVPMTVWQTIFVQSGPPFLRLVENALIGPALAIASFVCSIGNIPMAAVLWHGGISFGGVIAFIYADLLVLPILALYKKYFGKQLATYIFFVLFTTIVLSAIIVDLLFNSLGIVPQISHASPMDKMSFEFNYTFYLNLFFGTAAMVLAFLASTGSVSTHMKTTKANIGDCCSHQNADQTHSSPSSEAVPPKKDPEEPSCH